MVCWSFLLLISFGNSACKQYIPSDDAIDRAWQKGRTLPATVFKKYPLPLQDINNDNGINVMVDLAHQCKFVTMWGLPERLNNNGFRAIGNQATLNSVLDPDGQCRVRVKWNMEEKIFPFAWHQNFQYNVIITYQSNPEAQDYLPEEQEALVEFVKNGGGLLILATPPKNDDIAAVWSLNQLCQRFNAGFTSKKEKYRNNDYCVLEHGSEWNVIAKGENGGTIHIRRSYEKGFVSIIGHEELLNAGQKDNNIERELKDEILMNEIRVIAKGKNPVGGEPSYPVSGGGGGGIYPELEKHFNDIVLFYASNQKPELLKTVNEDIPKAKELVEGWLPSKPTLEPMYLILSSGGGGGWAVNAFKPKETGIISLSRSGILSIFAHELAHTMHGPVNDDDEIAGIAPIPNRGEAHAGWFQGKIDAYFEEGKREKAVKNCNSLFDFDEKGDSLDLVKCYENEKLIKEWGKGKDWIKTWWIWQKLDDRYGPTWYPRWKYVQHTRWADDPDHRLTWDEMVEDMSVAVGEDLFPFLRNAGLSLQKERLESFKFQGKEIKLDIAPIRVSSAGKVILNGIGDYKKPVKGVQKPARTEIIEPYKKSEFRSDSCDQKVQGGSPRFINGYLQFSGAMDGYRQVDPQIALGGGYVFHGTNTGLYIYDKKGNYIDGVSQNCFKGGIDPKLFYDPVNRVFGFDLWVYWDSLKVKPVNISVSKTSDPKGAWNVYSVPAPRGVDGGGIGFSKKWIGYSFPGGNENTFIMSIKDAIEGIPTRVYHFEGSLGHPVFTQDKIDDLYFFKISPEEIILTKVTDDKNGEPVAEIVGRKEHGLKYFGRPPRSPQKGTEQLTASGDRNPKNLIIQNGYLWFSHAVNVDGRSAVQWHQVELDGTIIQSGILKHDVNSYIQTTIGVNKYNDVVVGFQETGPNMFISPRMAFRYANDPKGELREIIKLGEGSGATDGVAWGDYSGTTVDGDNLTDIWTIQSIANNEGRGETVIVKVPFK